MTGALWTALLALGGGETYVVSPGGDDANPGTEARPWRTLQKAASSVGPGDTVRIQAGEYFIESGWRVSRAGTPESPITYRGEGEARITSAWVLPADGWTHVKEKTYSIPVDKRVLCVFQNASPLHQPGERARIHSVDDLIPNSFYVAGKVLYVRLEDGSHPKDSVMRASSGHVVTLHDCHHTVFEGLTVEYGFTGFKLQRETTHHVTIRKCVIRSICNQGIQPVAKNCVIEQNLFQKIGTNKFEHGIYGSEPGTIVRRNVFEEISGAGIHQYNQGQPAGGGCEFSGNVFRKPRKMTVRSGSAYYLDIIAWGQGGNRIVNNVFYGEGKRGGISLNSPDNQVYHNTFVGSTYGAAFYEGKPGNRVVNNIVQDARTFVVWPANSLPQTLDYNLYHGTGRWEHDGLVHRAFDSFQKAAGEAHSRFADPLLAGVADARVKPGSPAIDAGTALKEVATDIDGLARPSGSAPDIGAYEQGVR